MGKCARFPIDVLAVKIASGARAFGNKPLGAIGSHPNDVALGYGMPFIVEPIDTAALEDEESVFHDMNFYKGEGSSWIESEDVYGEVMAEVGFWNESAEAGVGIAEEGSLGHFGRISKKSSGHRSAG
jgi:hypothetical protein